MEEKRSPIIGSLPYINLFIKTVSASQLRYSISGLLLSILILKLKAPSLFLALLVLLKCMHMRCSVGHTPHCRQLHDRVTRRGPGRRKMFCSAQALIATIVPDSLNRYDREQLPRASRFARGFSGTLIFGCSSTPLALTHGD